MGRQATESLIRAIAGSEKLMTESLCRSCDELRRQLEGPAPTPLEKLAIQRVLAAHLEVELVTVKFPEATGQSLGQQKQVLRCKESAQKRFDAAMKSLLLVRSLLLAEERTAKPETLPHNGQTSRKQINGKAPANRIAALAVAE
jgi:hypothetical protein